MRKLTAPLRPSRSARRDDGVTLVEMIVAMGITTLLLILVTMLIVRALAGFRTATAANNLRAQQQNASLWISRLVEFIDNPVDASGVIAPAFVSAGPTSFQAYTFSGTGPLDRVPYLATVTVCATGDSGCVAGDVVSRVATPIVSNGALVLGSDSLPTYNAAQQRVLVPTMTGHVPTLALTYSDASGNILGGCAVNTTCTPTATIRALDSAEMAKIATVNLSIKDSAYQQSVRQITALVNSI